MKHYSQITERRKAKRIKSALTIDVRDRERKNLPFTRGVLKNISTSGILFKCPLPFTLHTVLEIKLYLRSRTKPVTATMRVCRQEEIIEGKLYTVGAEFLQISAQDMQDVNEYLKRIDIDELLKFAFKQLASDIHLLAHQPPLVRIDGILKTLDANPLDPPDLKDIAYNMITDLQIEAFEKTLELDTAYTSTGGIRARLNLHYEKGNIAVAIRLIPIQIPTLGELKLPAIIGELSKKTRGLILVTGASGMGKSTTLAALINIINSSRNGMIISIEDPIEFIHPPKKSYVQQREINIDTLSFANALRHIMRQDPNVVYIGEIRDYESLRIALTAAETGSLVLTTLHTPDAVQTINRIIDMFPYEQQRQVRAQLADTLEAVICQTLIKRKGGPGRIVATEILLATQPIRSIIRTGNIEQIYSIMQTGIQHGMSTLDISLQRLVSENYIDTETALVYAKDPKLFIM